jgi:hypothetical protein
MFSGRRIAWCATIVAAQPGLLAAQLHITAAVRLTTCLKLSNHASSSIRLDSSPLILLTQLSREPKISDSVCRPREMIPQPIHQASMIFRRTE